MCGRVFQTLNVNQLLRAAGTKLIRNENKYQASYNMGPTNYVPAVRHHSSKENNYRELDMMKWGYEAPFGQFIINARAEEAHEKKTFKALVNSNRCVVIVEGYFEWTPNKEAFVFRPRKEKADRDLPAVMYLAAIYAPDETIIILTKEALRGFHEIHERMPVVLDESEIDMWLDCENYKYEKIIKTEILNEKKEKWSKIYYYQVSSLVNSTKHNSEKLILSLEDYIKQLDKTGIKHFFEPVRKDEGNKEENSLHYQEGEEEKEDKADAKDTQSTQATLTTQSAQSTLPSNGQNEGIFAKEDKENKKKVGEDGRVSKEVRGKKGILEENINKDNNKLNIVQKMVKKITPETGSGRFKVIKAQVLLGEKRDKQDNEKNQRTKGSKKRKEPVNNNEDELISSKKVKMLNSKK